MKGRSATPMSAIPVVLTRAGTSIEVVTDTHGRFTFEAPAAGTYSLAVRLPDTHFTRQPAQVVDVADRRACVESRVDVFFNGRVAGRVIDEDGRGVGGVTVSCRVAGHGAGEAPTLRALTHDDGSYGFDRIPPGPLSLSVELPVLDAVSGDGITSGGSEPVVRRLRIGAGERLSLDPLVVPRAVHIRRVHGAVYSADGWPAPGARVYLKSGADGGYILGVPAVTDSLGRFFLTVVEGEEYLLFAERDSAAGRSPELSDVVGVTGAPALPPVRLTVRPRF
jgi:hypothetical protein